MMKLGAPLHCVVQRTAIRGVRSYGTQQAGKEALFVLLPFADTACILSDARRLFLRCVDSSDAQFDESILRLRNLGLLSPSSSSSSSSSSMSGGETIVRKPVITVELNSINASDATREEAISQLLYGIAIPLLYSCAATKRGSGEAISAAQCLTFLQHTLGASDSAWRFVPDLVNDALLRGVRSGLLHPSGTDLFRLHNNVLFGPTLMSLQLWWWRQVMPSAQQAMAQRRDATRTEWLEAAHDSAQRLLEKHRTSSSSSSSLPVLLTAAGGSAMDIISDAARCWGPCEGKPVKWQLHLADAARIELLTETMKSAQKCLVRRPAGVPLGELSTIISWPAVAPLLRAGGLQRTLTNFPHYFTLANVHNMLIAQHQRAITGLTDDETLEWLARGNRESLASNKKSSSTLPTTFAQDIDVVARAVGFLRRRHRNKRRVLFSELHAALSPRDELDTATLVTLHYFDVVSGLTDSATWSSVAKLAVELSPREVKALQAMEAFRNTTKNEQLLYEEALEPFLLKCSEVAAAHRREEVSCLLLDALGQWVQWDRIGRSMDLGQLLKPFMTSGVPRFTLDLERRCIQFEKSPTENDTSSPSPSSPSSPSPSSVVNNKECPEVETVALEISLPPPPPPRVPKPISLLSWELTYDSQLTRVLQSRRQEAHVHFVQATLHAIFALLLPIVSIPSGVRMDVLLRRVRWGTLGSTLGSLVSFIDSFDGLFFDVFRLSNGGDEMNEPVRVAAFGGPVGPFLLYGQLFLRLFPSDVDVPLRFIAENLSWGQYFAQRFGDLPGFLRRVGRSCVDGQLRALCNAESTRAVTLNEDDDVILFELLEAVRKKHEMMNNGEKYHVCCSTDDIASMIGNCPSDHARNGPLGREGEMPLAKKAVLRLPFFFSWNLKELPRPLLRVTLPHAPASESLVCFVEAYVCPLLRRHCDVTIAELDERLGWSHGTLDRHPGVPVIASQTSLRGVLKRYVESVKLPRLLLLPNGLVRPNLEVYTSPEDLLLEVNGLETVIVDGAVQLMPVGRPVSLFELIAEEQELLGGASPAPREQKWWVAPQCDGSATWEYELATGRGDILVWCDLKERVTE